MQPPESPKKTTTQPLRLIAACAFGLESIVRRQLATLDIDASVATPGRLAFDGDWSTVALTHLHLRCADRVLLQIGSIPAADFDQLFDGTGGLPWAKFIPSDGNFPVNAKTIRSQLTSVPAIQRAVKKATSEALLRQHTVDHLPETGSKFAIEVSLIDDVATITIDATGRSLHRRGYRTDITPAPLKETLAAALVQLSYWRAGRPLLDPFCGSGTIPIEAAMIGRNIPPGLARLKERSLAFCHWPSADNIAIDRIVADAEAAILPPLQTRLVGRDIDPKALAAARRNAARAGVDGDVHFQPGDAADATSSQRFGCVVTNPPYGERIGDDVRGLYARLPTVFARLPTWSHYVLTAVDDFERIVGKPADRRRKLYNGRIACTYFQYHGPKPVAETKDDQTLVHAVGEAAFGGVSEKSRHQSELFASRLTNRAKHLRRFPTRRGITCYRLYERDVPEIPLVVDRYEDHLHITEFERPHDRDPAEHERWLDLMVRTAAKTLDFPASNVHLKSRRRQRGLTQHEKTAQTDNTIVAHEGGLKFIVNLDDYIDTGLFLDHRVTRSMVRKDSSGRRVLNLFCYTGSFTVYAIDGGAKSTASVDLSKTYTRWTESNLSINKMTDPDRHQTFAMDVGEFIANHSKGQHYDLVVLDPPTFSNSKRTETDWDVQRHAAELIANILPLMSDGGVMYFSSNFRRFKFDPSELPLRSHHEISKQTVPEDYRNRRIHRCWRLVK